jgi:hypothetical protein
MEDSDEDEIPILVAIDEPMKGNDRRPQEVREEGSKPVTGKQFERQVPVTLITGYLGVLPAEPISRLHLVPVRRKRRMSDIRWHVCMFCGHWGIV